MDKFIIEQPYLQSSQQWMLYTALTSVLWIIWIYLWLPLVSLIAWGLGIRLFAIEMMRPENLDYLRELLLYGQILLLVFILVMAWSSYNLMRFRGVDRRRPPLPVTESQEAEYFGVPSGVVEDLKCARVITVRFAPNGRITETITGNGNGNGNAKGQQ